MLKDKQGVTLIEIVISVTIMGILSSIFLVNIRTTDRERLTIAAEQLAADLRQIRNKAISRTIYDMNSVLEYPSGGYGLAVISGKDYAYKLFADNGQNIDYQDGVDELIKEIVLDDSFEIEVSGSHFFVTFLTEHNIRHSGSSIPSPITVTYKGNSIDISLDYSEEEENYWGMIRIGEVY